VAVLCALLALAVVAAPAVAQDPSATPEPTAAPADPDEVTPPQADPGDDELSDDEVPPESTPHPSDDGECVPPEGADGDYAYCGACDVDSTDSDYVYCAAAGQGAVGPTAAKGEPTSAPSQVRAVPAGALPYTGADPLAVSLFGLALLLGGAGLRRLVSSGARRP
jgi:hypothetical protein